MSSIDDGFYLVAELARGRVEVDAAEVITDRIKSTLGTLCVHTSVHTRTVPTMRGTRILVGQGLCRCM